MTKIERRSILILALIITALLVVVSLTGVMSSDLYAKESLNWKKQSIGQDKIDLILITPVLLITSILIYLKSNKAIPIWVGTVFYLTYTFIIYSFAVHFNILYPLYCLILGLCFYSIVYFFFHHPKFKVQGIYRWLRFTGIYFILLAVLFYFLWLSEILPAIFKGVAPTTLQETGLPINPVHSIDLAFFLPGLFLLGIGILRKNPFAIMMAPAILAFLILMNLTIAFLALELNQKNLPLIMGGLAVLSGLILTIIIRKTQIIT